MRAYKSAKEIAKRLVEAGYKAYFAGGWVRDYLMRCPSLDIDIATDATPEKIMELFPKTIPVGVSFGVVVVVEDGLHFEVATFRQDIGYFDGRRPKKINFSSEVEDAKRRDFTINGMFFDPMQETVIDYVDGIKDIKAQVIRTIGDPNERFHEDRLRMIRAVRFACRFGFQIEENTRIAIEKKAKTLLSSVAIERVWQELKKMSEHPHFESALVKMFELGLLQVIFPNLSDLSVEEIATRVSPFAFFPKGAPTILFVMELFQNAHLSEQLAICQYLKVSNKDCKIVELTSQMRACAYQNDLCDNATWVNLYADAKSDLALQVIAARCKKSQQAFLRGHERKREKLKQHIENKRTRTPIVSSEDLKSEGIKPGKYMGILLNLAEELAANKDIYEKEKLLQLLKQSKYWPQC